MKIKYVGLKQKCTAFQHETGITWTPGSAYDVDDAMASRMLRHTDVFASAEDEMPEPPAATITLAQPTAAPDQPPEPSAIVIDREIPRRNLEIGLSKMDDAAVRAYAKEQGLKIQGLALTKGENLRAKVLAALEAKG